MRQRPEFENYMPTTSRNYGMNSLRFFDGAVNCFWFSYTTLVAFKTLAGPRVCRENVWGPTTGKHLNAIEPDHSKRVAGDVFERLYTEAFGDEPTKVHHGPARGPARVLPFKGENNDR